GVGALLYGALRQPLVVAEKIERILYVGGREFMWHANYFATEQAEPQDGSTWSKRGYFCGGGALKEEREGRGKTIDISLFVRLYFAPLAEIPSRARFVRLAALATLAIRRPS